MPTPERTHILDPLYGNWALISPFVSSGEVVGGDLILTMDDGSTVTIPGVPSSGVTAGPFTTITSITVVDGIVTVLTGT